MVELGIKIPKSSETHLRAAFPTLLLAPYPPFPKKKAAQMDGPFYPG
jgi:hypothetical protein